MLYPAINMSKMLKLGGNMIKKNWLRGLILGIVLSLILISGIVMAQADIQEEATSEINVLAAPPMSGFIHIRVDGLENRNPKVAYNSRHDEYLVVWEEEIHGGEVAIYGRRVGINGNTIGAAFSIQHFTNRQLYWPDVAYSAKQDKYLVSFHEKISSTNYDIAVVPVSWNGVPGSGYYIDFDADWDWYPAVEYNTQNDEFLVVWEKCISCQGGTQRDIEALRIRASDGALLSWRNLASSVNMIRRFPSVVYNSIRNEYLIAYTRHSNSSTDGDIIGIKINFNMSGPVSEFQISPSGYPPQDGVALAAGPDEYLAVWYEDYGTKNSVWGRRINGDGSLQPFISLANDAGKHRVEPAVAFGDGGKYLITWRYIAGTWDIYGRNVKAGHNSPEGPEFPIDNSSNAQKVPAVGCAPIGPCLVVEEDNFPGGDYEIRGRMVGYHRIVLPITLRNQ
jgi:hypothetical protein